MERVQYEPLVIQDLANLKKRGELNLNPWYQRRAVWSPQQKAFLINTLFMKMPVPTVYVRHSIDLDAERSIKEVVDGQQRIRSILEFTEGKFSARHPAHKRRVKYDDLSRAEKSDFRMTALSVGYLIEATDSDVIEIFGRINSVAKTLNPQEKRNARFGGEFKQFCLTEAASRLPFWRDLRIFTANDIARMQEVQFVSEIAINMLEGLSDYNLRAIDDYYERFDEEFPARDDVAERLEKTFTKVGQLAIPTIRDTVFSRAPLFFSLLLALDQGQDYEISKLERGLHEIDRRFNSDVPIAERPQEDAAFYIACTSNMHRIKSRRIRQDYLAEHLS